MTEIAIGKFWAGELEMAVLAWKAQFGFDPEKVASPAPEEEKPAAAPVKKPAEPKPAAAEAAK